MRNFILTIFIAFLISIVIHLFLYLTINDVLSNNKLKINTTNKISQNKTNGFTTVRYVKIKKPIIKPKKEIIKPKIKKVQQKKKKIVKKISKKVKVKKEIQKIQLPSNKKPIDLKKLFTIQKPKEKDPIEKLKEQKEQEEFQEAREISTLDPLTQSYIKLYGEKYYTFSETQKTYLKENLNRIGRITQRHLNYPGISIRTRQSGINIVEFFLHPNGDITDLHITDGSNYTALDNNTIETIEIAYKDYPRPIEKVKIKIYVQYILN